MRTLIKCGRVIDPATGTDEVGDLLIEDGRIAQRSGCLKEEADLIIDASGCFIMPGFIDLHVHLREPGFEYKETIKTGAMAAARGGFTTICAMPNTKPATDSIEVVEYIVNKAKEESVVNVLPVGAISKGQSGTELADIEGMKRAGICAVSEDGKSVMDTALYKKGMQEAARLGLPVLAHCEDKSLVGNGVINEGDKSEEFGLPGISNAVEDIIVARDIILAKETGARLHLCHCSTADSVKMVKAAKEAGLPVTAEVCPHHFALTTDDMKKPDTNYKMNPPLRTKEDMEALKEGLKANIMDAIATDHAPHHIDEKAKSMLEAPFGIVGLETAAALTITELVEKGFLTPLQMADKMSYQPAKILGIERGTLQVGKIADITIINPVTEYNIDVNTFASKGKNTPFHGCSVKGKVLYTLVNGNVVYQYKKTE